MDLNPWGEEATDIAPLPPLRSPSPPQTPSDRVEKQGWSVPAWSGDGSEEREEANELDDPAWPGDAAPDDSPARTRSQRSSPAASPSFAPAVIDEALPSTAQSLDDDARDVSHPTDRETDDFGDFGDSPIDSRGRAWEDSAETWGGSSEWPAADIPQDPVDDIDAFPSPQLELPEPRLAPPKWDLEPAVADQEPEPIIAGDVRLPSEREEQSEDAWAAQAREEASRPPALPARIPAELLVMVQDRCNQLCNSAFAVAIDGAFSPPSGMGLALTALLDHDGQLSHLAALKSVERSAPGPLFIGSNTERLYRSAVEATASRSAEIIKGSSMRRAPRMGLGGGASDDIWGTPAPAAPASTQPNATVFDFPSALATPMLPSERVGLDTLSSSARATSPSAREGSLFSLFGRRTPSTAQTNMPASLLQPKRTVSPAPAQSLGVSAGPSVSNASRTSDDDVSSKIPPSSNAPIMVATTSVDSIEMPAAAASSAVSRFFGRISSAAKSVPQPLDQAWFRKRQSEELQFPTSRYEDQVGSAFKDDVGFSYDNGGGQVSTSPTMERDHVVTDVDDLFNFLDKPTSGQRGSMALQKQASADLFGLGALGPSPEIGKGSFNANGAAKVTTSGRPLPQSTAPISAAATSSVSTTSLSDDLVASKNSTGPMNGASAMGPPNVKLPSVGAPNSSFASFALAPPPASMQPLNRSVGPSLLDMDEDGPTASLVNTLASSSASAKPPPTSFNGSKPPASTVVSGSGSLSLQDLSFFEG